MNQASPATADEIQLQMRAVRSEMREDVQEIVASARVMADWRYYLRTYPWLCLAGAAAAGYLLVPPRVHVVKPDSRELAELIRHQQVNVKAELKPKPSNGILGGLINMAAGAALQGAMAIASYQLDQLIKGWRTDSSDRSGGADHEKPHH